MERRGELVFEWQEHWYSAGKIGYDPGPHLIRLPDGNLLKTYDRSTLSLDSCAEYYLVREFKETDSGSIVPLEAKEIEGQYFPGDVWGEDRIG